MRTGIVESIELAIDVEQRDLTLADDDGFRGPRRDVGDARHSHELIAHAPSVPHPREDVLLKDYRDWLESELELFGDARDHAYSLGQANMTKRAIEKLDEELVRNLYVAIDHAEARRLLTALEAMDERTTSIPPELAELRDAITAAMQEQNENPAL
jgi:hypothetical protein